MDDFRMFVERFRELYPKEIKPLIEKEHYDSAKASLQNIVLLIHAGQIANLRNISSIPHGLSLLTAIELTHDRLEQGDYQNLNLKYLENCLEQTRLPTEA